MSSLSNLHVRQAHRAQLDAEAEHAATQAAGLSDRLAGAEQDLGFEITRNAERLHARDEDVVGLRIAATAAEQRVSLAEDALRLKDRELEELRARGAREGFGYVGGGGASAASATSAELEYRVFVAAVGAQTAAERCSAAAGERRAAAGSALSEALRAVGEEEAGAEAAERRAARFEGSGDEDPGGERKKGGVEMV